MTELRDLMARARAMMTLAESVDGASPGAAGLAYQAADLAVKVLIVELDGADPWAHEVRNRRASELLGVAEEDLMFMFRVRLLDFYAGGTLDTDHATWGGTLEAPSSDDCRRAVSIAGRVVRIAEAKLRDADAPCVDL